MKENNVIDKNGFQPFNCKKFNPVNAIKLIEM